MLPDEPTEITLDLIPTAQLFNAGNRIRVVVMGADSDNTQPTPATEAPTIRLYRGAAHPSGIRLPVALSK